MIRKLLIGTGLATLIAFAGVAQPIAAELPAGGTVAAVENTKGPLKIVFQAFQNNPFWIPVTAGEKAAAEYLKQFNAQVDYVDLGDTLSAEKVIAGIESAVAQKYNGIVIVPIFERAREGDRRGGRRRGTRHQYHRRGIGSLEAHRVYRTGVRPQPAVPGWANT